MQITLNFGRWTTMKSVFAVAASLALGGAVGTAVAISPTVPAPIKWAGGVQFSQFAPGAQLSAVYTAPAGANFMLTDLIVSNFNSSVADFTIHSSTSANCSAGLTTRLLSVAVPPLGTLDLSFATGVGFQAGHRVCVFPTHELVVNARGYLFTAVPAS